MAIDAVIERVRRTDEGLRLELAPRYQPDCGYDSCPGQPALTITGERAWEPRVGMEIWGSANSCEVVDRDPLSGAVRQTREYERLGYTRLREARR